MSWHSSAACLGAPPDVVFPWGAGVRYHQMTRASAARALAVCAVCPVQSECLEAAIVEEGLTPVGVRGGLVPFERRVIALARGVRQVADGSPCGTESGRRRHTRDGEPSCEACRRAKAKAERARSARRRQRDVAAISGGR